MNEEGDETLTNNIDGINEKRPRQTPDSLGVGGAKSILVSRTRVGCLRAETLRHPCLSTTLQSLLFRHQSLDAVSLSSVLL